MPESPPILKTYKLFIDGKFPRSESGRSTEVASKGRVLAHVAKASRKDLRDAVEAARKALPAWAAATAYLRGQILYRMAEMLQGKHAELAEALAAVPTPRRITTAAEVDLSIDRLVHFAGWADKFSQVLGCHNPVAGPYYNFTIAEPTGVVAVVTPDEAPLLSLISLLAPALCAGNTAVVVAASPNPLPAAVLGEVLATSDVPAGVVNILTGDRAELLPHVASHRDIDAIHAANLPPADAAALRAGVAENIKRVHVHGSTSPVDWKNADACHSPWWIEPFVEMKTVWHPSAS
jgi:acyl-CoA reductase-like NAD-dependent aldehyde dehydrogenase